MYVYNTHTHTYIYIYIYIYIIRCTLLNSGITNKTNVK